MIAGVMKRDAGAFGARLRALRQKAGFTQEELATITGLSVHAVSALERGERRRPQFETVRALSAALDLTPDERDALVASARAQEPPAGVSNRESLPVPASPLIGRDGNVSTLRRLLADPAVRLVTLVGPGGVGKTRLGLEIARLTAQASPTRVAFVALAALRDPAFVPSAIAESLGLTDVSSADLGARVRAACEDTPTLLVLDNFEHLLDAASLVANLLAAAPSIRLLVTSRAPLRVRGEREFPVLPLALEERTDPTSLQELASMPAVRLFLNRIQQVQPDFRLTPENGPAVEAICRRLDALPLALELAAPWIKVLTPEELLRRLDRDVLLSIGGPRDLPERQQTMNATVGWSYRLLDRDEQRAFRRFGVFPGVFSADAAAAVLGGRSATTADRNLALTAVAGLVDRSLLVRAESPSTDRPAYRMLETIRAYAMLELTAAGERNDALERLARYTIGEAALAAEGLVGTDQIRWFDRVRENLDSYRAALSWLIERGRAAEAADIAWALMFFWLIRGHTLEGHRWYEQILGVPGLPREAEAKARLGAASTLHTQADPEGARAQAIRALDLLRDSRGNATAAHGAWIVGHIEHAAGDMKASRRWFTKSLDGFTRLSIPWGIGSSLSGLAWVALATGDPAEADRLIGESGPVLQAAGPWFLSLGYYLRVLLTLERGSPDEVIALMRQSLRRVQQVQDRFAVVYGLVPLAAAAARKGEFALAAKVLGVREGLVERTGSTVVDPTMRGVREETERAGRARLGADRWTRAFAAGRRTRLTALLADIDRSP
jgi:predicted ATPase/DNA-binding XRE family transcriptional regulator